MKQRGPIKWSEMCIRDRSTVIAVFENIVAFGMDLWGWSRKKAVLVNFFAILVLSLPCVLGYNVLSDVYKRQISSSIHMRPTV